MEYTVLICDDDEDILSALEIYLGRGGYRTLRAKNGLEAVEIVGAETVHLIILDIMMPVMDGIRAAVRIRESCNAPILFLSAKGEDTDRVLGLDMGGDDYIVKPFNPVELLARARSALRRYARLGSLTGGAASENIFRTGGLVLDDDLKRVTLDGSDVALTALEYNIVKLLISNSERVFTSAQIYEAVWGEPAFYVSKTVSVHIRHIREKIEINPKDPQYLKVIYGLGYKMAKLK